MRKFIKTSVFGGLLVILPAVILFLAFRWVFKTITRIIEPLVTVILNYTDAPVLAVDLLVIMMMVLGCFIVGSVAATSTGKWLHSRFDSTLAALAPGYNLVRDIVHQFFGDKSNSPFTQGEVATARLFGPHIDTMVTGVITSRHQNNWVTLFVPTGPNPTSGMIYHLPLEQVQVLTNVKVEEALRTIIACGAGSAELIARSVESSAQLTQKS